MSLFDKLIEMNKAEMIATVQAGAVWQDVEKQLNINDLSLRVMPTSSPASTAGGWLAQGGAGLGSFAYGAFRDNVISAKTVLANGDVKEFSGNDLDNLYGAMGTTGIITEITVKRCDGTPNRSRAAGHDVPSLYNSVFYLKSKSFICLQPSFSSLVPCVSIYLFIISVVTPSPTVPIYPPSLQKFPPHSCFLISGYFLKMFLAAILLIICIILEGAYLGAAPTKICT
jgi:hypothetical protein